MMRSASRRAHETLHEQLATALGGRISAATLSSLAEELYAVADLLVGNPRLRRTLGDPATKPERRSQLVEQLFDGKVAKATLDVVKVAAGLRWSSPWDFTDALEAAGDEALFAAADKDGSLERVEDELFRFERILQTDGEVTGLLDEHTVDPDRRSELLDTLIGSKVAAPTLGLLRHAVRSSRKRSIALAIDDLLDRAAARQERSVARVISAVALSDDQQSRLTAALSDMYGRAISIRTALDPTLRGGLVVRVGDEVIDGSIATRFAGARAAVAG